MRCKDATPQSPAVAYLGGDSGGSGTPLRLGLEYEYINHRLTNCDLSHKIVT